jgi:cell wall-associated NlpC family hydrolase
MTPVNPPVATPAFAGFALNSPPRARNILAPRSMIAPVIHATLAGLVLCGLAGCASRPANPPRAAADFARTLERLRLRFAPDSHLAIYQVTCTTRGPALILSGDVDSTEARAETLRAAKQTGAKVIDRIQVLPAAELGETNWGIITLSVANGREDREHKAELGTQAVLGEIVRVLKRDRRWLFVQTRDHYPSWMEAGSVKLCTEREAEAWQNAPLLMVSEFEAVIREAPAAGAAPVSDVVIGCRVKKLGETGEWFRVELPDGRTGFLPRSAATDFAAWQRSRHPTPDNIEATARQLLGRPYLWGANTPRGMDCSGFTKLVFFLNGIELHRNASQQARQGAEVPLDRDLSRLEKGDLLFFGFERPGDPPGRISHTGIYLGDKLFIQSSGRVRISSLDPNSPIADAGRIRGLMKARRVLPAP